MRGPQAVAAIVAAAAVGLTGACARAGAPPGGPEDRRPPVLVRTVPAPYDTVTDLDEAIRFDFDERISERISGGTLADAITISPRGGRVDVSHGRSSLTVRVRGGLRPGQVYRVTLAPVVSDMFGNQLTDPFELVFSTGGDPSPNTLAGQIWDRVTGRGVPDVTVHAVAPDSLVHVSSTDRDGVYAFRYLPAGDFEVAAFEDRNRNDTLDSGETRGVAPVTLAPGDTILVDIPVLRPDTLSAVMRRAEALDSVTVVVGFDDFLDPEQVAGDIPVELARPEGSAPAIGRILLDWEYTQMVDAVADSFARLDSIDRANAAPPAGAPDSLAVGDTVVALPDTTVAADTLAVDSARALPPVLPGRTPPPSLPALQGARPGMDESSGRLLPGARIVLLLDSALDVDVEYTVTASSVVNINGLGGGGGEATFVLEAPAPDTAVARDTLSAPIDTLSAPVDTLSQAAGARAPFSGRPRR